MGIYPARSSDVTLASQHAPFGIALLIQARHQDEQLELPGREWLAGYTERYLLALRKQLPLCRRRSMRMSSRTTPCVVCPPASDKLMRRQEAYKQYQDSLDYFMMVSI